MKGEQKPSKIVYFSILQRNENSDFGSDDQFYKQLLENLNKMENAIVYYINV